MGETYKGPLESTAKEDSALLYGKKQEIHGMALETFYRSTHTREHVVATVNLL